MLKKIYKNNGFIYISDKEKNIKINNLFLKLFIKYNYVELYKNPLQNNWS